MREGSWFARTAGLIVFAIRRTLGRLRGAERTQIGLSVAGVAIAITLMLLVTSVAVGLSASETVRANDADFAIIPAGGSSAVTDVGRARLGQVHQVAASLTARDDIEHATAIRTEFVQVRTSNGSESASEEVSLLVVGVSPTRENGIIAGLPTEDLDPMDPHYANGTYSGRFTGEMVLSEAAADRLAAREGTVVRPQTRESSNKSFSVVAVREPRRAGLGQLPVALVHLSELQNITGATAGDAGDQLFVESSSPGISSHLETVYPETIVVSRDDLFAGSDGRSSLPLAIAIAAFVVSLVVGTLFLITTMGFELAAESEERAVMRAVGISRTSRAVIVVMQAFVVAVAGGILGIGLWLAGIGIANSLSGVFAGIPVATFRPILLGYGMGVSVLIGLLTVPYLLFSARRRSLSMPTL